MSNQTIKISSRQTRHYGSVSQEFAIETIVETDEKNTIDVYYERMNLRLDKEFSAWEANHMPRVAPAMDTSTKAIAGGILEYTERNGKSLYKWKSGEWSTWGVPVYDEVLQRDLPEAIGKRTFPMDDCTGFVEIVDGKAKRVTVISCPQ